MPQGGTGGYPQSKPWEAPGLTQHQREWLKAHPGKTIHDMPPYNPPGPYKKPPAVGSGGGSGGKYDVSKYTGGAVAEATQIVQNYGAMLGWPGWYNADAMLKRVLEQKLQMDPESAYKYLWSITPTHVRDANPNAYFGLTKQQYKEKINSLSDMFNMITGSDDVPKELRNKALSENWTQSELQSAIQKDPALLGNSPWASVGLTYRDISTQFGSTYGFAPNSPKQLASWWKFRTGAQQVGGSGPAQEVASAPPPLTARSLTADVAAR